MPLVSSTALAPRGPGDLRVLRLTDRPARPDLMRSASLATSESSDAAFPLPWWLLLPLGPFREHTLQLDSGTVLDPHGGSTLWFRRDHGRRSVFRNFAFRSRWEIVFRVLVWTIRKREPLLQFHRFYIPLRSSTKQPPLDVFRVCRLDALSDWQSKCGMKRRLYVALRRGEKAFRWLHSGSSR